MRHITGDFKGAHAAGLRFLMGIPERDDRDYLVVTGMDLNAPFSVSRVSPSNTLKIPLPTSVSVDVTLGKIASWMNRHDIFEQSSIHGDDLGEYNISLYFLDHGGMEQASLVNYFFLKDYVLGHCRNGQSAQDFNTLMWTLDRDRLAFDIRESLRDDFGISARRLTQYLWQQNMRACCHPDKPYQAVHLAAGKAAQCAAAP